MSSKLLFVCLLFVSLFSKAQDTITFVDGKEKIVVVNYETPSFVMYQKIKKGDLTNLGKQKNKSKEYIYKIAYFFDNNPDSSQKTTEVYKIDSAMGDFFNYNEMGNFVDGKKQARANYKAFKYAFLGVFVGAGGSLISPYWGTIPCAVYTTLAGSWAFKPFLKADNPERFNNIYFNAGYREQARKKNAKYSALGSLTGLIIGSIILQQFPDAAPKL